MFSRSLRARLMSSAKSGGPHLTLAKLILLAESFLRCFARPLFFAVLFAALAWLGFFTILFPYAHLLALIIFTVLFFDALGNARQNWEAPSESEAKRRVEEASGLAHRPLDVVDDRPVTMHDESFVLWQEHAQRARAQLQNLRLPRWKMNFNAQDPYRLRYVLSALLIIGVIVGWGTLGGRVIAAINPALGRLAINRPTIDAWITPPDYTHMAPIMIATPAGDRFQESTIVVPEGSVLHAHLAEKDGDTPVLIANGEHTDFNAEDGQDFSATTELKKGAGITIRRGWMTLGSWNIRIVTDTAPQIAFTDTPTATERKDTRVAYEAKDDYGVTSIALRMTPRARLPGLSNEPVELPLATTDAKDVKRVDFKDLTAEPWAGMPVDLQLVATDATGHQAETPAVNYTLPERVFFQPIARALIEERKKLLSNIFDLQARNEIANLMAGVASQPASYGGDRVVAMALRAGAVRLVLDHDKDAALAAQQILWQTAMRIEDGSMGMAQQNLRDAQKELADALDRNASEKEVQTLIDRLHQALARYMAEISTRVASRPSSNEDLGQVLGSRSNVLTPQDLERMLDQMKTMSAAGQRDAARQELSKLQQIMENLRMDRPQMSEAQKMALEKLKALKELEHDQQALLDKTFQQQQQQPPQQGDSKDTANKDNKDNAELAKAQSALHERLQKLMKDGNQNDNLSHSADAMQRSEKSLRQNATGTSVEQQGEALKAMQQAANGMSESLRQSMFEIPQQGSAQNDPFGRDGNNFDRDPQSIHLPDHVEAQHVREILDEIQHRAGDMARPKTERDYIERLLQNF